MSAGNERFNDEAAAWDSNPFVHKASESALQAILAAHPALQKARDENRTLTDGPDVLEIGCGTGLLSTRIAPYVRSLTAIDAASGMIDALRLKLARQGDNPDAAKITPICVLLEDPEDPALPAAGNGTERLKFDLVLSHLVLHHIPDLRAVLTTMYGCLKKGGEIALTDFEDFGPQARRFHPEARMLGVERDGIPAKEFAALMKEVGFRDVNVKAAWSLTKEVEGAPGEWVDGKPPGGRKEETMDFPFLLCRGKK